MPRLAKIVALAQVADVTRSIEFYKRLGFVVANSVELEGAITWAWLDNGAAALMVTRAEGPIVAGQQTVLFYLYGHDVAAMHRELTAEGIEVGAITTPFYSPQGEFRVTDPDGYCLMFTHND